MLDLVVPPTLERAAKRSSTLLFVLALCVLFLFPPAHGLRTVADLDRRLVAGALFLAAVLLRFGATRKWAPFVVLAALGAGGAALGVSWFVPTAIAFGALCALSLLRARLARGDASDLEPERPLHEADIVRENVEAIVTALILALVVKGFVYEAFQIPTSSMEPTILGAKGRPKRAGDRLLASHVQLLLRDPPRWSICVFRYPLYRRVNYIKRIVGLPGEELAIRGGDVYVDGKVVAKPDAVQESLWLPFLPVPGVPNILEREFEVRPGSGWRFDGSSMSVDAKEPVRAVYHAGSEDLRIDAAVELTAWTDDASVTLAVQGRGRRVEVGFGAGGGWIEGPGVSRRDVPEAVLPDNGRIGLGVADRVARIYVNGRQVARIPTDDARNDSSAERAACVVTASSCSVRFDDVRLDRDIEYQSTHSWKIGPEQYIALGDNTDSSKDSRVWNVNVVRMHDGREFAGEATVKTETGKHVSFGKTPDGKAWDFLDVDGVRRVIPTNTCEVERGVRAPFVNRDDLIGRAFLIFFPVPPAGDWRPRFLP